jgi:hypothetical protein
MHLNEKQFNCILYVTEFTEGKFLFYPLTFSYSAHVRTTKQWLVCNWW